MSRFSTPWMFKRTNRFFGKIIDRDGAVVTDVFCWDGKFEQALHIISAINIDIERICRESQANDYLLAEDRQPRKLSRLFWPLMTSLAAWALAIWFAWCVISNAKGATPESDYEHAVAYCYAGHAGHFNGPSKSEATEAAKRYALCVCRIAAERRMGSEQVENLHECEAAK